MKRLVRLLAAGAVALMVGVALAPAASAEDLTISGDARCDSSQDNGTKRVIWKFHNDRDTTATLTDVAFTGGGHARDIPPTVPPNGTVKVIQGGIPSTSTEATATAHVSWPDGTELDATGTVALPENCAPQEDAEAEPPVISVAEACGVDSTLTIPASDVADYFLNGEPVTGTVTGPVSGTVTAEAKDGFVLTGTTSWPVDLPATRACEEVTPTAPEITQSSACDVPGSFTVVATTGVRYEFNGSPIEAGTVTGRASGTLVAIAEAGYTLTGTTEWTIAVAAFAPCEETPPTVVSPEVEPPVLANTGAAGTAPLVGLGTGVIALGALLLLVARRRREV